MQQVAMTPPERPTINQADLRRLNAAAWDRGDHFRHRDPTPADAGDAVASDPGPAASGQRPRGGPDALNAPDVYT